MTNEPSDDELLRLVEQLDPGDLSNLEICSRDADATMMAVPGSASNTLWQHFTQRGWMTRQGTAMPAEAPERTLVYLYKTTPAGRLAIHALFQHLVRRRDGFSMALKEPYESLYPKIARQIGEAVASAGGTEHDLVALLGAIVASTLNVHVQQRSRNDCLNLINNFAWSRLR